MEGSENNPLTGSSELSDLKVEIELKVEAEDGFAQIAADFAGFLFSEQEVATDPSSGLAICLLCLEELTPQDVIEHMVVEHKYRKVTFKCCHCEKLFEDRQELTVHKRFCQPKKKKKISLAKLLQSEDNVCPICLVEVSDNLPAHLALEHGQFLIPEKAPVDQPLHCPVCNKMFKNKVNMSQHVKLVHQSVQDSVSCHICGQKFSSSKYLRNHVRNVHPVGNKTHRCELCRKTYKNHQSLYQHLKRSESHKQRFSGME